MLFMTLFKLCLQLSALATQSLFFTHSLIIHASALSCSLLSYFFSFILTHSFRLSYRSLSLSINSFLISSLISVFLLSLSVLLFTLRFLVLLLFLLVHAVELVSAFLSLRQFFVNSYSPFFLYAFSMSAGKYGSYNGTRCVLQHTGKGECGWLPRQVPSRANSSDHGGHTCSHPLWGSLLLVLLPR